jgi:hypothetical protein
MPKVSVIQTNFTAGEITPRMKGRVDVARYQTGADVIENGIPVVHGGVDRRDGTRYLAAQKYSTTRQVRLIRYVFSATQAYMLEFGHLHVRVYASNGALLLNSGLTPLEIPSPFTEAQLWDITTKQGADTMFLFHPDVPTQRLRRLTSDQWSIQPVPWAVQPFAELGHSPDAVLHLSAMTVGVGRTFTTADTTVPDAPTIGAAVALNAGANVAFTPPANNGGLPIGGYEATSSPGGFTGAGTSSPIHVGGLTNGVAYTFTVTAANAVGLSAASAASNSVTPSAALPTTVVAATASPADMFFDLKNGLQTGLLGATAVGAGGLTPYQFAWVKLSGSPNITITTANAARVVFQSSGVGVINYAAFRCTVTDGNGYSDVADVNVTVEHSAQFEPGGMQ